MKPYLKLLSVTIIALFLSSISFSQTITYSFDGQSRTYKSIYKAELTKNIDEINIYLLEEKLPDLDKMQDGELIHHPEAMNLLLAGVTEMFPISPKNKLVLTTTYFQRGQTEFEQGTEIANKTAKALEASKPKMETEVKKREEKIKELSKRIQQGDMAATEELQKVAAELEAIINGEMEKLPNDEIKLTSKYFDVFINMPSEDASQWQNVIAVSGTLTVDHLNDNRLKASFSGMAIYESEELEEARPLSVSWDMPLTVVKN